MRPSVDQYFVDMARQVSTRATCRRRAVGCVLVDQYNRVLSTGYNGVPPGVTHCIDRPCAGAETCSGKDLDACIATHAEINALLFCPDIMRVRSVYLTVSPCIQCIKALLTTSAERLVCAEEYESDHTEKARKLWQDQKREWKVFDAV